MMGRARWGLLVLALVLVLVLAGPQPSEAAERFVSNVGSATLPGGGANTCTSSATPCHTARALAVAVCGDTITFLDGTYQGANYVMQAAPVAAGGVVVNPTCTVGSQMTVRAQNDGRVFFDGQFQRMAFNIYSLTYWNFEGFDSGNTVNGEVALWAGRNTNISIKRHCASNENPAGGGFTGLAVFTSTSNTNSLFEDICAFGWGRLIFYTSDLPYNTPHTGNTFRRLWMRCEGFLANAGSGCGEPEYYHTGNPAQSGGDLYENLIWVYTSEQQPGPYTGTFGYGTNKQGQSLPDVKKGSIMYGRNGAPNGRSASWWGEVILNYASQITDAFVDGRSQTSAAPFRLECTVGGGEAALCSGNSVDRVTALRNPSAPASTFRFANQTNISECTDINSCPNFYTGSQQGGGSTPGARNCFEYTNGVLGSTTATQGLWPWRMDDRIKAALARANAAGKGGSPLAGTAGIGYAANTVTSEIVSRYGAIPTQCRRTGVPNVVPNVVTGVGVR